MGGIKALVKQHLLVQARNLIIIFYDQHTGSGHVPIFSSLWLTDISNSDPKGYIRSALDKLP
jgi:hypothetical protein